MRTAMLILLMMTGPLSAVAEPWKDAAPRREGEGPYRRLVLDGGILIDGTGAPARGPVAIVIEGNRIVDIRDTGGAQPPADEPGTRRIDVRGSYIVPGMIDTHMRIMDSVRPIDSPDYALKLLLAHGITTVTSMQELEHLGWAVRLSRQSEANSVTAPRVQPWVDFDAQSPAEARAKVKQAHATGACGLGEGSFDGPPEAAKAAFAEANRLGMRVSWHMNPIQCPRMNALDAARAGLQGLAHWYCLPETLFEGQALQHFPAAYNFSDVHSRFAQSGRLWKQAVPPGHPLREKVLNELRALDFTLEPTFSVYEANRDYMRTRYAEWNRDYLHPVLEKEFMPSRDGLFSHFYDWSSTDEAEWRNNFRLWMQFVNEFKNRGGRVVAGSDSSYMWTLYGFGFIRNLEMMEEAGFTPLEVITVATMRGAEHLKLAGELGSIEPGKLADLVVVGGNPLENLKVFYGTGFETMLPDGNIGHAGGVRYTVKDGIVFDAPGLLADVREIVRAARMAD